MNGIVSSVSSNAFFNLLSFFISLMEQKMSKLAENDTPSFCFRRGRRFLESSEVHFQFSWGKMFPKIFPLPLSKAQVGTFFLRQRILEVKASGPQSFIYL